MDGFEDAGAGQAAGESNAELDGWEELAATLQPPPAQEEASLREGGSPQEGEPSPMPPPEAAGLAAIDANTLATLVGEEVASVLKAAQVAAAEIRSKAEDVAADALRRISEMQSALAHLSVEMTELMTRTTAQAPVVPGPERTEGSATPVDEAIVIEDRSDNGSPTISEEAGTAFTVESTRDSDPAVDDRPGDYQRWLQRMGELSSQEPR
jgi:hypothetical protein